MTTYRALVVDQQEEQVTLTVAKREVPALPVGYVQVAVDYSSINYKDFLATQYKGGVIRNYPMVPGIDASGTVVESHGEFTVGQQVVITGFDFGMTHPGGFSEIVQVPANWVVALPVELSTRDAMMYGTAGFTAARALMRLERQGMSVENQPRLLVTGATGGVGSIAVGLLAAKGYQNITAVTRKTDYLAQLEALGAQRFLQTDELLAQPQKLLMSQQYDYVIDTVGGEVAARLLSQIHYGGAMAMLGNAAGVQFETNVLPFILRGVDILGIDSVQVPLAERPAIWRFLTEHRDILKDLIVDEVALDEVSNVMARFKQENHVGRTIVRVSR